MPIEYGSSLAGILRQRATESPDRLAYAFLRDGDVAEELTYQELHLRAGAIARALQARKIQGRVLLVYPQGLEVVAAFFGCLTAGLIAVPVYPPRPGRPDRRLAAICADSRAELALTTTRIAADLVPEQTQQPEMSGLGWLATDDIALDAGDDLSGLPLPTDGESVAYLQYTSGSTSTPKGVVVTHRSLLHTLEDLDRGWGHTAESVMVSWLPLFHDMGLIYGMLQAMYKGFPCYLMDPAAFVQHPSRWLEAISRFRGTHSAAPNFAFDLCTRRITEEEKAGLDLRSWQVVLNAAEPVREETQRNFVAAFGGYGFDARTFCPGYGLAESTLKVSSVRRGEGHRVLRVRADALLQDRIVLAEDRDSDARVLVACGRSEVGARIAIVDPETGLENPPDRVGEIWVRSDSVAAGYWERPEATAETFGARIAESLEGPFLRTGDLGFVWDGQVVLTGRLKDLILIRGANHYPQDIELTAERSHPSLRPGCNAAFSVEEGGEEHLVIVLEVQRAQLQDSGWERVMRDVREAVALEHSLAPSAVVLVKPNAIQKTSSGKIQRRACREAFLTGRLQRVAEWRQQRPPALEDSGPSDGREDPLQQTAFLERWLARRLARTSSTSPAELDLDEPFSRLGIDSLAAVRLSGELETLLGRTLPTTLLFEHPTPRALSQFLTGGTAQRKTSVHPGSSSSTTQLAVIGMACRFSGASDVLSFWNMLCRGEDRVSLPPPSRGYGDFAQPGYFLEGVERFDPGFFSLSPREVELMDPQQRLLLEVAWEALENAGQTDLAGSATGVFVGISSSDYFRMLLGSPERLNAHCGTGGALSIAANRLSYQFDLHGPSLAVDTACSSSLVAVHQACQSLRLGECDLALVGGVNLVLSPELTIVFSQARMLAADGRCKTFDADADGYGRGEGCGVVVLKRLPDALRDGDTVLAVVAGSAVNQDGRSNGLTAPNGRAQQEVVRRALSQANVLPAEVTYIETHGTGTPLGDPIEINALKAVLTEGRSPDKTCWLGSVKPNVGHLEAAAGIAGFIKTVLALQHGELPPQLHFSRLNPQVTLDDAHLAIPTCVQEWRPRGARIAGISSFGFGGTNAHVVLREGESAVQPQSSSPGADRLFLLTLSAKTSEALTALTRAYHASLDGRSEHLSDICFSANTGRTPFRHRRAIVADSADAMRHRLAAAAEGNQTSGVSDGEVLSGAREKIAFLFSGQGSHAPDMGKELFETEPVFRRALEQCNTILSQEPTLLEVLYGNREHQALLERTEYAQPALFALEYALAQLWHSWGIRPDAVIGHSLGEYVAACVAGVFDLEDGLRLVAERGRRMAAAPGHGAMAAVFASESTVRALLESSDTSVQIAALNGPANTVISGASDSLAAAQLRLEAAGLTVKRLATSHAFHSALMEPVVGDLERLLQGMELRAPRLPLISNLTGEVASAEVSTADYWCRQMLQPVRFAAGIRSLTELGCRVFLELGPRPVLLELTRSCLGETSAAALLPSLRTHETGLRTMLGSLAELYVRGLPVDWRGYYRQRGNRRRLLPTYPFQRQPYWYTTWPDVSPAAATPRGQHGLHWREMPRSSVPPISEAARGTWWIFSDKAGTGEALAERLEAAGNTCWRVYARPQDLTPGPRRVAVDPGVPGQVAQVMRRMSADGDATPVGVVYCWCLDGGEISDGLESLQRRGCDTLVAIVQVLERSAAAAKLWLVSQGAAAIDGRRVMPPGAQDLMTGMGKVIALETSSIWGGMLDLDPQSGPDQASLLLQELLDAEGEDHVAFRQGKRFVPRLSRTPAAPGTPARLDPGATYLIVGGLGVLGLKTAHWLVLHGARRLVLTGRRPPGETACGAIRDLESLNATVETVTTDVSDEKSVAALFDALAKHPQLKGVVHAAGESDSRMIRDMDPASPGSGALAAKVAGGWLLHQHTRHLHLDFFVCYSSLASVLGAHGNAYYAAANRFLDALAHYRHGQGLPALSLNWGPWGGGMATPEYRRQLLRFGVRELPVEGSAAALDVLMDQAQAQVIVADVDWKVFGEHLFQPLLLELAPPPNRDRAGPHWSQFRQDMRSGTRSDASRRMLEHLQAEVARLLRMPASQKIDPRRGFFELGMDSIVALELRTHLQKLLDESLPQTLAFEMPNLEALTAYLVERVLPTAEKMIELEMPEMGRVDLAEIRGLSETELELFVDLELQRAFQ